MEISPIKKKRRPATNKERSVTTQKERPPASTEPETPARSSLKQGRYGVRPSTPAPERMHLHNHKRVVVEAAFAFDSDDDRFKNFLSALASLLTFCRMVDEHFIINPVKENSRDKDWSDPTALPTSMTALGAYFLTSGNPRIFEKARAGPKAKNGKKDSRPQAVYFTFAISSDLDPEEIMARVSVDWSMLGGTRLTVKSLGFFDTSTPIAIYFLWNEGHAPTLLEEFKTILNSVSHLESGGASLPLPQMSLRKQVPRTPGQVTETFNHLSLQAQMARKAWHVEVQSKHTTQLIELVRKAKSTNIIQEMWGRQVHISEVADNTTPPGELKRYVKFAQRHVNFHCSMTCEDIRGIVHLDATATIYSLSTGDPVGELSLRQVLLKYLKMSDGTSLIAEIHQRGLMGIVEIIVPNTAEAEAMVLMMNRQFAAYCYNALQKSELDVNFIKSILKEACCPTLFAKIHDCVWDAETCSISTPEQIADEKRMAEIEKAAWYRDEFGKHMVDGMKKVKNYTDPEALYNLDGERSVKTLHTRNDRKLIDVEDEDDDDDEDYSTESDDSRSLSLEDLSLNLSVVDNEDIIMGSPPKSVNGRSSHASDVDEDKTRTTRVGWHSASSVDESAPAAMAGSG